MVKIIESIKTLQPDSHNPSKDHRENVLYGIKVEFQGRITNITEKSEEKLQTNTNNINIKEDIQQVRNEMEKKIKNINTFTSGGPVSVIKIKPPTFKGSPIELKLLD